MTMADNPQWYTVLFHQQRPNRDGYLALAGAPAGGTHRARILLSEKKGPEQPRYRPPPA
ncbi:MAG TPA: hypothetical protein VK499_04600 [Propionibacteriaceae bacterium]|jgi:hypothetical protein|nr:hypothetical protein [Propionibacteriaceae bacterium]